MKIWPILFLIGCNVDKQVEADRRAQEVLPSKALITGFSYGGGCYEYELFWPDLDGDNFGAGSAQLLCLLYTSPSPRDQRGSRMPSSA